MTEKKPTKTRCVPVGADTGEKLGRSVSVGGVCHEPIRQTGKVENAHAYKLTGAKKGTRETSHSLKARLEK